MLLVDSRIQDYKCIDDTGPVALEPGVTCLVGKNESGKTAFLEALYRLNPIPSGLRTTFNELYDYPRRRRAADRDKIAHTRPVTATFQLEPADREAVAAEYGDGVLASDTVTVARCYQNQLHWSFELAERAAVKKLARAANLPGTLLRGVTRLDRLAARLDALAERTESQQRLLAELRSFDLHARVSAVLAQRLPKFLYFDEYNILPGRFSIPYLQRTPEDRLGSAERTALAFLRLAGVDTEAFQESEYEARKAALEGAANQLTDEIFEFWSQDRQLRVDFDADFRAAPGGGAGKPLRVDFDHEPGPTEQHEIPPFLEIRIWNERHRLSLNFGERSNGFVWFFSFLSYFSNFRDDDRRVILLLDEPGHSLHAYAQRDLMRFINTRLARRHQVFYTTHSPFMVEPSGLHKVRTVEDDGERGTRLHTDLAAVERDTVFPLKAAVAYEFARNLAVGEHNLVVPKAADVVTFQLLSDHLAGCGRVGLDPRWELVAAGGLRRMAILNNLLGQELGLALVLDATGGDEERLAGLVEEGLFAPARVVTLTAITGTPEAEVEDLFEPGFYLGLLRAAGLGDVKVRDVVPGQRILKTVAGELGHRPDPYRAALHLQREQETLLKRVGAKSLSRFEELFGRINALLAT